MNGVARLIPENPIPRRAATSPLFAGVCGRHTMTSYETEIRGEVEHYAGSIWNPVWPHRFRERPDTQTGEAKGALVDDSYVRRLLQRIGSLEQQTRPSLGEKSAMGKDLAAFEALSSALELVSHVAGWAIDHQCGLAKEGLEFLPLFDPEIQKRPEYSRRQQLVDTHEHERIGALTKIEGSDNAQVARRIVRNILLADNTKGVFPHWLNHELRSALRALDFGEMLPLLEPIKVRKKRGVAQLRLQLIAVSMVAYRQGLGMTEEAAREYVARRMGQSEETLKSWKTRLRDRLGYLVVESELQVARKCANLVKIQMEIRDQGFPAMDPYEAYQYDDEALKRLAVDYQKSLKA